MLLTEPDIWDVGGGKLASNLSGGVEPAYTSALVLANNFESGPSKGALYHEISYYYHLHGPGWLVKGTANFLETYTLARTDGGELERRLSHLEASGRCGKENIQQHLDDHGQRQCDYDLGERFLLGMYTTLGPRVF